MWPRRRPLANLVVQADLLPLLREVVGRGGHLAVVVRGQSMTPTIHDGDRVVLGPLPVQGPALGDLVTWMYQGRAVLHRLVEVSSDLVRTRGDALVEPDAWIPRSEIIAVVVSVERRSGRIRRLLRAGWSTLSAKIRKRHGGLR